MKDYEKLYLELLYAVENKYPGESRHETALRYIRETPQMFQFPDDTGVSIEIEEVVK